MPSLKYTLLAASLLALTAQTSKAAVAVKLNLSCSAVHGADTPCPLQRTEHSVVISQGIVTPLFSQKVETTAHGDQNVGTLNTLPKSSAALSVDGIACGTPISPTSWKDKRELFISGEMNADSKVTSCTYKFR